MSDEQTEHLTRALEVVAFFEGQEFGREVIRPYWTVGVTEMHMVHVRYDGPLPPSTLLQLELVPMMVEPSGWVLAQACLTINQQRAGDVSPVRFRARMGQPDEQPTGVVRAVFPQYRPVAPGKYERGEDHVVHCTIRSLG